MKRKKLIKRIALGLAAALVAGFFIIRALSPTPEIIVPLRVTPLAATDLSTTVEVTGNIESESKTRIYSTINQPIELVAVEVGDSVKEGDLLCQLDTTSLEADIESRQATVGASGSNNAIALQQAKTDLYYAEWYYENNQNAEILSAKSAVEAAERNLQSAEFDLRDAGYELNTAKEENRHAESDGNDPVYDRDQMSVIRNAVSQAELRVEGAQADLASAKQRLKRAEYDAKAEIQRLKEAVTRAANSANQTADYISLEALKEDLEKCTITAPGSGIVTAVYAREGASGNGLLFVVENPDSLIVESSVKEYDVNSIRVGQPVRIKTDATGDEVFDGEVLSIAPASAKDNDGMTVTGSTASFALKIRVTSKDPGIRIGMNVRASVITAEKKNTMAVLYDAVATDPDTGTSVVYVAEPVMLAGLSAEDQQPDYIARMVPVETGMETDLYMEVSGELKDGDLILQDPTGLYDGMPVHINNSADLSGFAGGGGPGGPGGGMGRTTVRIGG